MSDIVERLRLRSGTRQFLVTEKTAREAATLIEAQAARIERLERALKPFADEAEYYEPDEGDNGDEAWRHKFRVGDLRTAARALNGGE